MHENDSPPALTESRFRKAAAGLAALGGVVFVTFLKLDIPAIPMGIGAVIWIFWTARALFAAMPREIRLTGWSVSLFWHVLLLLPAPFYLIHPAGVLVLFQCLLAVMFSFAGIKHDRSSRRAW